MFKVGPDTNNDYPVMVTFYDRFLYIYNNQCSIISHKTLRHDSVDTV